MAITHQKNYNGNERSGDSGSGEGPGETPSARFRFAIDALPHSSFESGRRIYRQKTAQFPLDGSIEFRI